MRAICEAARDTQLGIVVPMVTDINDIQLVKQRLIDIAKEDALRHIQIGTTVEVPAAAITIRSILLELDFVRIDPGDLTQFTLANLRMNISPTELSDGSIHPAVLALIENVTKECRKAGKPVATYLDIEPRITVLQILLSVGIRTFCIPPPNVLLTLERLREVRVLN